MKYMGSKRAMLHNGLGELLDCEAAHARRFVDLFAGSGAVAIHIARHFSIPVLAFDLQEYSVVLTRAVLTREDSLDWKEVWQQWIRGAEEQFQEIEVPQSDRVTQDSVKEFRNWSAEQAGLPITRAYGGYYFSPDQTVWIDALLRSLPSCEPENCVALAAIIQAASQCAAAPGHTAQPFQPTSTAKKYLNEAWRKDIVQRTQTAFEGLAGVFAKRAGDAVVRDANEAAKQLRERDVAFIDPPYSGVHYSRFYHVLETIARGESIEVSGKGRYPAPELRPRSRYSVRSEAADALNELLKTVASKGARAVLTFPEHECSNGLSGRKVTQIAERYFVVNPGKISSTLSTLGGTGDERDNEAGRAARKKTEELILVLAPK